jgi:predicted ATPase/DNA-binding winged helix-turn-helix (wHTH) protein
VDDETFVFGSYQLIPAQRLLLEEGKPRRLGSRALDILVTLVENAGETVRKDDLIARVWPDTVVDEGALRVHVAALRKALGDGRAGKRYIANNAGRGYTFVGPVTLAHPPSAPVAPDGATAANNLPVPLTRIIGRDEIIAALAAQLRQRRLLTIVGPGGIGKTTVATAVAKAVAASFPDGVWFVGLASLQDPDLVPSALSTALGISLSGTQPVSGMTAWLRDKHILIVLDNCEHVIGAIALLIETILKAARGVCILVTSREPLRAEGEWLHRLASLELPLDSADLSAVEALRYSAVELFNERAMAAADGFTLDDANVAAVLEICRRLDGMPLALELAAARTDVFGVRELAAHLDDRFRVLTSGRRTALPRHQTLGATLDWSYRLLSETERTVLRRLGVFAGGFTLQAASTVAADDETAPSEVVNCVANLMAKSLVTADAGGGRVRYRLLESTRAYALEKLVQGGEFDAVARRHTRRYLDLFEGAEAEAETRPTNEWVADYRPRMANLSAALDWAFSPGGDTSLGVALTAAAVPLWMQLSLMEECRGRVERALAAIEAGAGRDSQREMKLLAALATGLVYTRGDVPETGAAWTRALEIAESLDDAEYQLRSLWGLWSFHINSGHHGGTLALAQRFCTLAVRRPDPNDRLIGERMIGVSQYYLGDQISARNHLERVLTHYVPATQKAHSIRFQIDQRVAARAFLARVLWLQGFPGQAMLAAESAFEDARAADHATSLGYALAHAACPIALWVGDLAAAEHYVEILLDHSRRHGLARWRAFGQRYQGVLVTKRGDLDTGLQLLGAGFDELDEARSSGLGYVIFRGALAEALGGVRQIADGIAAIEEALLWTEHSEERWLIAELLRVKGEILLLQGATEAAAAAEDHFLQALDWARRQGALSWELRAATSLARLLSQQGRFADATVLLQPVYDRFTEGFDTADLKAAKALLDVLAEPAGSTKRVLNFRRASS